MWAILPLSNGASILEITLLIVVVIQFFNNYATIELNRMVSGDNSALRLTIEQRDRSVSALHDHNREVINQNLQALSVIRFLEDKLGGNEEEIYAEDGK